MYILFFIIISFYIKYFYIVYIILYIFWFINFFLKKYFFKKGVIFIKFEYFKYVNWTNLLLFIVSNFFIKLPIFVSYFYFYKTLCFFKKENFTFKKLFKNVLFYITAILIRVILQLPLFVLIKSFEALKYLYENLTYFNQPYKNLIGNYVNIYVLQTVFFWSQDVINKKVIIQEGSFFLNPFNNQKNPSSLNKILTLYIQHVRVLYGKSLGFKKNHINYVFFLKKNINTYSNMIFSNNTKSDYINILGKKINTNFKFFGYSNVKHSVTPLFFTDSNSFEFDNSQEARILINSVLEDKNQVFMAALSFIKNYQNLFYYYNGDVIEQSTISLKNYAQLNNFDIFENEEVNDMIRELDVFYKIYPNFFNSFEEYNIINNFIENIKNDFFSNFDNLDE